MEHCMVCLKTADMLKPCDLEACPVAEELVKRRAVRFPRTMTFFESNPTAESDAAGESK